MHYRKGELCYLAQTLLFIWGVTEKSLISLGGQEENASNKKIPPTHP